MDCALVTAAVTKGNRLERPLIKHVHRYWGIFCQQTNFETKGRPLPSEQLEGDGGLFTHIPKHKRSVTIQGSTCTLACGRNNHDRLYTTTHPHGSLSRSLPAVDLDIYLWLDVQTVNSQHQIILESLHHTISYAPTTIIDINFSFSA